MLQRLLSIVAGLTIVGPALGTPHWIAYEGDDFPENEGGRRGGGGETGPHHGGAERSLENGILTLDGLRNDQIWDFCEMQRSIDPGLGESFRAEWRVLVDPRSDYRDVNIVIARDTPPGHVYLELGPASLWLPGDDVEIELEPSAYHEFVFSSEDMGRYHLVIDGAVEYVSSFDSYSILNSFVNFGDGVQGQRSNSQWDYFRFGVVPEPAAFVGALLALGVGTGFTRAAARRNFTFRRRGGMPVYVKKIAAMIGGALWFAPGVAAQTNRIRQWNPNVSSSAYEISQAEKTITIPDQRRSSSSRPISLKPAPPGTST